MIDFEYLDNLYIAWKTYAKRSNEIRTLLAHSEKYQDESVSLISEALDRSEEKQSEYFMTLVNLLTLLDDREGQEYADRE